MPQKRNPYALPVIRGAAGLLLGKLAGVVAMQQTPSARTDNLLYTYREVVGAVQTAADVVELAATVIDGLTVDEQRLRELAQSGFAQATDVAEALTQRTNIDYRSAYRVVARAAAIAVEQGCGDLTHAALEAASAQILGRPGEISANELAELLDPQGAVDSRTILGGAAAAQVYKMVLDCRARAGDAAVQLDARARRYAEMPSALSEAVAIAAG